MGKLNNRQLAMTIIWVVCVLSACTSGSESRNGVARIETHQAPEAPLESLVHASADIGAASILEPTPVSDAPAIGNLEKSDEEIVTNFSACMREEGWDLADPELNADGTINIRAMLSKVWQTPGFGPNNGKTRESLNTCLPILQNIGFTGQRSSENEIELEDNLLEFAQCLREKGLSVPDPDFSLGGRGAMRPLIQDLDLDDLDIQEYLATCRETAFGGQTGRRPGGNSRGSIR